MAITLIDEAISVGARCHKACEVIGITCRTLRRWRSVDTLLDRRQQPTARHHTHALSGAEKARILALCNSPEHQSLPPSQIVPRLADLGVYIASESSFYRVLKAHGQLNRRGRAQPPRQVPAPKAWVATGPNQVWTWDITYLPGAIRGQFYRLYMIIDVYSRMIMGWEIHTEELALHAANLIDKACLRHEVRRDQLVLHSDNGSPMKGATMLATLQKLGVVPSFSRPSVSNDNPYSEALFKTLKYTPAYPRRRFADLTQARAWVQRFTTWYNTEHRHSGIQFVTPVQRHLGQDRMILARRKATYELAKQARPDRWKSRQTRAWHHVSEVWLNPAKVDGETAGKLKFAA